MSDCCDNDAGRDHRLFTSLMALAAAIPKLLQELIEMAINYIYDDKISLAMCTLVSSFWLSVSGGICSVLSESQFAIS
jgi:hypothetical protein